MEESKALKVKFAIDHVMDKIEEECKEFDDDMSNLLRAGVILETVEGSEIEDCRKYIQIIEEQIRSRKRRGK